MNRLKSIKMKVGQKSSDSRLPKPPKPPEKPLMPYMRYSRKVWESVKNANGQLKLWEVGKIIGQMWRELPENEKTHFVEEYENDKLQYNDALRLYHSSPAYKSWLLHKEKVEKSMDDNDSIDSMSQSQSFKQKDRIQKDQQTVETRESYILEDNDEDPEEVFTAKHVAAQRFQRNHKLMLDLYSDFKIPELGIVVTEIRLNALKQQVNGLISHKRKLDEEMEESEKSHDNKKMKIKSESEKFWAEYSKELEARPIITEKMFSDMVKKARDEIIREEKEREDFIMNRLNTNDKQMGHTEHGSTENGQKSDSMDTEETAQTLKLEQHVMDNCVPTHPSAPPPAIPLASTSHNKASVQDVPVSNERTDPLDQNMGSAHQPTTGSHYMHMPAARSQPPNYDHRSGSATGSYNYLQSSVPQNQNSIPGFQTRYGHPPMSGAPPPLHKPGMLGPGPPTGHMMPGEQTQKYMKSSSMAAATSKSIDHGAPIIDKESMAPDIKHKGFKEFPDLQYPPPKISESSPCPSNVSNNSKAPILSPECEPEPMKSTYYDSCEPTASMQSPTKKATSKKRKPPSKSKSVPPGSQSAESDSLNSSQMPPDICVGGAPPLLSSHTSPSKMGGSGGGGGGGMDPGYQNDPNFSQMPMQQGMYPPYHYYPQQFVPHGRPPGGPYGSSYQPGPFNQANYYNPMPQAAAAYRAMAPHQVQQQQQQSEGAPVSHQYAMQQQQQQQQKQPVPHNQPSAYNMHPYGPGPGPYGGGGGGGGGGSSSAGCGPQFAPSNTAFGSSGSQPGQDALHPGGKEQNMSSQQTTPSSIASQMGMVDDSPKYPSEVQPVSGPTSQGSGGGGGGSGFNTNQMPPPGYSSQYSGMPYGMAPPMGGAGTHYPGVQGHFYYPTGPPQAAPPHPSPGQSASPDHPFWSHQQSSNYSSMQSLVDNSSADTQAPKIQE